MKVCFKCERKLSLTCFYVHRQMADGYLNKCKECTKSDAMLHRGENLERIKRYDRLRGMLPHRIRARRAYQKTEKGKLVYKKSSAKWLANNMEKRAAHIILGNAVRDGKIKKEKCKLCKSEKSQAHHKDYTKPLAVEWLCAICHRFKHKLVNHKGE